MMSIPTASTTAPPTTGADSGGGAATLAAATPEGAAGFEALIGSLLQGAALPDAATLPVAAPPSATTAGRAADTDDQTRAAEAATADLLATLGLAPLPSPLAAQGAASPDAPTKGEPAPKDATSESAEREAEQAAPPGAAAAALLAAAAAVVNPTKPPSSGAGASAATDSPLESASRSAAAAKAGGGTAAPAVAPEAIEPAGKAVKSAPLLADAFAALIEDAGAATKDSGELAEEPSSVAATGSSASSSSLSGGLQTLNAWAAAAHRLATAQDAAPRAVASPEAQLRETVGTPRWKDELGARITLMATQGQQGGSLRLSPEHLGPLEIQITVNDDKSTNVQFGAQHAETRTALQDALPRLREMFSSAGLQLGDAGVSQQAPRQRPAEDAGFQAQGYESRGDGEPTPLQRPVRSITHSGLLDTYA